MSISAIPQGTTRVIHFTLTLEDDTPIDISGDVMTMTVKAHKDDDDPGVAQETADVATDGANGVAIFTLSPDETDIDIGQYYFDVVWKPATGGIFVLDVDQETIRIIERVSDVSY